MPETFGGAIRDGRRAKGLQQKQLAALVVKEDGEPISAQFLNDVEHERRLPSRQLVERFASALDIDPLYLRVLAGHPVSDRPASDYPREKLISAIRAYRRQLGDTAAQRVTSRVAARRRGGRR